MSLLVTRSHTKDKKVIEIIRNTKIVICASFPKVLSGARGVAYVLTPLSVSSMGHWGTYYKSAVSGTAPLLNQNLHFHKTPVHDTHIDFWRTLASIAPWRQNKVRVLGWLFVLCLLWSSETCPYLHWDSAWPVIIHSWIGHHCNDSWSGLTGLSRTLCVSHSTWVLTACSMTLWEGPSYPQPSDSPWRASQLDPQPFLGHVYTTWESRVA